jgi:hypothetical protein
LRQNGASESRQSELLVEAMLGYMALTSIQTFTVHAIPADVVAELRARDDAGREPELIVERVGGSPLRCCLRASRPGERVLLASYAPLRRWADTAGADPGAYLEVGPVFIHAEPCAGPEHDGWPDDFRGEPRVLRGYGANGRLRDGVVIQEGDVEPERMVDALFADPKIAFIHARALVFGCFTFWIERAPSRAT